MPLPAEKPQPEKASAPAGLPAQAVCGSEDAAETDLSTLLDLQDRRQLRDSKQSNRVILAFVAFLLASGLVWYSVSATNRRKLDGLIQDVVKASRPDSEEISNSKSPYDRILEKLGTRSTDIDTSTRSLGVDPTTVEEDGMDAEMKAMMGGQGRTVGERKRVLENLANAAGVPAVKKGATNGKKQPNETSPPAIDHPAGRPDPAPLPPRQPSAPEAK